jgi:hypothetical protein
VASLYQNSCFRIAGSNSSRSPEIECGRTGACACSIHVGNRWARFRYMRRRVEDDTGTVADIGLSIANAQGKDRADGAAAAAALRPLLHSSIVLCSAVVVKFYLRDAPSLLFLFHPPSPLNGSPGACPRKIFDMLTGEF